MLNIYPWSVISEQKEEIKRLQDIIGRQDDLISKLNQEAHLNGIYLEQYDNLRKHFQHLVEYILGKGYYNTGMDVYTCDILTCEDLCFSLAPWRKLWRKLFRRKKE